MGPSNGRRFSLDPRKAKVPVPIWVSGVVIGAGLIFAGDALRRTPHGILLIGVGLGALTWFMFVGPPGSSKVSELPIVRRYLWMFLPSGMEAIAYQYVLMIGGFLAAAGCFIVWLVRVLQ